MWYDAHLGGRLARGRGLPGRRARSATSQAPVEKTKSLGLAVRLVLGDREGQQEAGRRLEVHLLGVRARTTRTSSATSSAGPGCRPASGPRPTTNPDYLKVAGGVRRADARPRSRAPTRPTRACSRGRRSASSSSTSRSSPTSAPQVSQDDQSGDRRADESVDQRAGQGPDDWPRTSGEPTRSDADRTSDGNTAVVRAPHGTSPSEWPPPTPIAARAPAPGRPTDAARERTGRAARRCCPRWSSLIIVTQLPFVATLVISFMNWNAYSPQTTGLRRARQLHEGVHRPGAALVGDLSPSCSPSPWCWSASSSAWPSRCCWTGRSSAAASCAP